MFEAHVEVEIGLLGPLLVRVGGREVPVRAPKQRLLLARLAATPGCTVSGDQLIDALWGDAPPATVTKNLQVLVGRLRGELGATAIRHDAAGYAIDPVSCAVDVHAFERILHRARTSDGAAAIDELGAAIALWRGEPAAELLDAGVSDIAARLVAQRDAAELELLHRRAAVTADAELIADLRAAVGARPANEQLCQLLTRTLHARGDTVAARATLVEMLAHLAAAGLAPGVGLRALAIEFDVPVDTADDDLRERVLVYLGQHDRPCSLEGILAGIGVDRSTHLDVVEALEDLVDAGAVTRKRTGRGMSFAAVGGIG